jgi:NTE family protein
MDPNPTNDIDHTPLPEATKPEPKYHNLVLSGGSTRGIAHIGAVKKLVEANLIDLTKLKALACTSAGAFMGVLIVLGFTIDEIWSFIKLIDFRKLVSPNILLFLTQCGIETGQTLHNVIEDILNKKTGIANITFAQLYEITKITFTVVGSCLNTKEAIYYNHLNTPDFKVSLAIRISTSMPGFFIPVKIDGKTYIDGAVIDNYPIDLFHEELDKTIGILICTDYSTDYSYPEEFISSMMNLVLYLCYKRDYVKYKENTVYINKTVVNMSAFDFDIDMEKKQKIYESGIQAVEEFIGNLNK